MTTAGVAFLKGSAACHECRADVAGEVVERLVVEQIVRGLVAQADACEQLAGGE